MSQQSFFFGGKLHGPSEWVRHGPIFFDLPKIGLDMARIGYEGGAYQLQCATLAVQLCLKNSGPFRSQGAARAGSEFLMIFNTARVARRQFFFSVRLLRRFCLFESRACFCLWRYWRL